MARRVSLPSTSGRATATPGASRTWTAPAQDALLAELAKNESDPKTPLERFFVEAKLRTIQGYYTSEIGIHKDLRYKGNQFLAEFVGYEEQA